jgi:hypothetical protein
MICKVNTLNISNEQEMRKLEALKVKGVQNEGGGKKKKNCVL